MFGKLDQMFIITSITDQRQQLKTRKVKLTVNNIQVV